MDLERQVYLPFESVQEAVLQCRPERIKTDYRLLEQGGTGGRVLRCHCAYCRSKRSSGSLVMEEPLI